MRSLLTSGIKAILAIAALSTAAHWTLRLQREPEGSVRPILASVAEPDTTGSIAPPRRSEPAKAALPAPVAQQAVLKAADPVRATPAGLDQSHLAALIAGASEKPRAKVAKR